MKKVAIIGGGPSGIMCALTLKRQLNNLVDVHIYEKNDRIGKKIIVSGNGKCNLTNLSVLNDNIYNNSFAKDIYNIYTPKKFIDDLQQIGLFTYVDSSMRVYPLSEASSTVMDVLLEELNKNSVFIHVNSKVVDIKKYQNQYKVTTNKEELFDYVVIATGSIAGIKETKDYNKHLDNLKLDIKPFKEGLVGIKTSKETVKGLSGIRQKGLVSLYDENKCIFKELGEVQFKDDGISGIVVMNASSIIARNPKKITMTIDFLYNYEEKTLLELLNKENKTIEELVIGLLPKMLNLRIINLIKQKNINAFIDVAKAYPIEIISTYNSERAQVMVGGISVKEMNKDLSLKKDPNIYIIGELLDVDGLCGGYNMHFAFASGNVAGSSIVSKIKKGE